MYEILLVVYLVLAIALIAFILIQKGKGAGMGAAFGSGASGTVFGSSGSGNFLTKSTTLLAIGFFAVALTLGNLTADRTTSPAVDSLFTEEDLLPQASPEAEMGAEIPTAVTPAAEESELPQATTEKKEEETPKKKDDDPS
jgi:preprotein translocase subunit SecG